MNALIAYAPWIALMGAVLLATLIVEWRQSC